MADDRCDLLCLDLPRAEELRRWRLSSEVGDAIAAHAAALADPTRVALAAALHEAGELCVCDLAWVVERAENLVSHHLRRLRADGLANSRREGKMVMYSLTPTGERLLDALLADSATVSG